MRINRSAAVYCGCMLLCLSLSACNTRTAGQKDIGGIVVKIHDGDSIHLKPVNSDRVIIRLAAIDAPELHQPYGYESRNFLRAKILNRKVSANCTKIDRYKRNVCQVDFKGSDINLSMLENGLAWHYKRFQNEQPYRQRNLYDSAERSARQSERGLWQQHNPVAPWLYRQQ